MIKKLLLALLFMALPYQVAQARNTNWSMGTAHTIEAKRYEVGVFQPLRYGLNDSLEISSHALPARPSSHHLLALSLPRSRHSSPKPCVR